jgi:Bacterial Ig-like domain (group 3)/FG-GAP-like repeat
MRTHTQLKIFFAAVLIALAALAIVNADAQGKRKAASSNPGSLSFLPVVTYDPGGPQAAMVVVADVNGDGKPDLIVLNCGNCYGPPSITSPGSVGIMLGNGDGTFQPAVSYGTGTASPRFVVVADVNGDGELDLIVANRCIDNGCLIEAVVAVLLGNGNGTFQTAVTYNSGGLFTSSVAVADVNGDGKPDLVVGNWCSDPNCDGSVGILLGNGNGTFQPVVTYPTGGLYAFAVAIADVNADGKPDVLAITDVPACSGGSCSYPPAAAVLLGDGDGTFRAAVTYSVGGFDDPPISSMLAVADVNDDGKPDLIVESSQCCGSADGVVGVLLGKGDGTFKPVVRYQSAAGGQGTSVAVADVSGDGKLDIVTTDQDAGANGLNKGLVSLRLGNGDGTFNGEQTYDSGGFLTNSVVVADINGDGKPDLIVANICADDTSVCKFSSLGVLLNNSETGSTSLVSSLNPSTYGQNVTWTATVTSSGSITPTGKVSFTWSGHTIGSATLNSSGVATLTKSNLNADTYPLTAVYVGDAANLGSTSAVLNQVVLEATSTATLTSSPNPSAQGQAVTFTAKISSPTVTPTGPVTFTAGKTVLGTGQLSGGKATLTISSLSVGSTTVTATYYGNSNIGKSSASVTQTVR